MQVIMTFEDKSGMTIQDRLDGFGTWYRICWLYQVWWWGVKYGFFVHLRNYIKRFADFRREANRTAGQIHYVEWRCCGGRGEVQMLEWYTARDERGYYGEGETDLYCHDCINMSEHGMPNY